MKQKYVVLAIICFCAVRVASAGSVCATGTLASYEALGSTGCTIGGVTVASFNGVSPGTTGATAIDPTTVTVTPSGGTTDPELTFSVTLTATDATMLESLFTYTISGPAFTSDTITLSGSAETGNGDVTDIQNYCVGGSFGSNGFTCPTPTSGALLTLDGIQNTDNTSIAGVSLLGITDDFVLDGGGTDPPGTASGGTFADQFTATSAVPEPGEFPLVAAGLVLLASWKFRSVRNS